MTCCDLCQASEAVEHGGSYKDQRQIDHASSQEEDSAADCSKDQAGNHDGFLLKPLGKEGCDQGTLLPTVWLILCLTVSCSLVFLPPCCEIPPGLSHNSSGIYG